MLITGSRALKYHFPDHKKEVNDWDFIATENETLKWCREKLVTPTILHYENVKLYIATINEIAYEFEIAEEGNSGWDYLQIAKNKEFSEEYADLSILYSLKKSHIHQPFNREKHWPDYSFLNTLLTADVLDFITQKRIIETNIRMAAL